MLIVKVIFWISLFIVFYSYLGYGILVFIILRFKKAFLRNQTTTDLAHIPDVALIIAAFNEEEYILEKIENTKSLVYPKGKLRVVFITDGSTDKTPQIIKEHSNYEVLHQPERKGKAHAMNRAVSYVNEPVLVFCDANTILNTDCILEMARHYKDENVGGVAGEKRIMKLQNGKAVAAGEGLYWKYESWLKSMDSELHSVVGAAGELFSVRKDLYEPVLPGTIIEDFVLTMHICQKGYIVKYEPKAYAIETASATMKDEQKRKVRICAGAFQAMDMLKPLLNVRKYGLLTFQYISHRVLRWTICPICLILIFLTNLFIVSQSSSWIYQVSFIAQCCFYTLALAGYILANRNIKVSWMYIPYYFVFMNAAVILGYFRYQKGQQSVLWEKAVRQKVTG